MVDTAVHDFTSKVTLVDTDEFYLVQSPYGAGDDRKTGWADIKSSLSSQSLDNVQISASGLAFWVGRSQISSPADGNLLLWNNAQTTFDRLQFGGTSSSFPALKRSSALLQVRLADDSTFADFQVGALQLNGHALFGTDNTYDIGASGASRPRNVYVGSDVTARAFTANPTFGFGFSGQGSIASASDGTFTLYNATASGFQLLQFGGTNTSFPALQRNGAQLASVLADNSAYADFEANRFAAGTAFATGSQAGDISASRTSAIGAYFLGSDGASYVFRNGGTDFQVVTNSVPLILDVGGGSAQVRMKTDNLRIDQTPTVVTSAAVTITNGADAAGNIGHRIKINFNGTDYWIPASSVAF